jgi:hypothetical protein
MGNLFYGNVPEPIVVPDDLLAHLRVVTTTKLRRGESFTVNWHETDAPGRSTIWIQPAIPLRFVFDSSEPEQIDPAVLRTMVNQANSSSGLSLEMPARTRDVDFDRTRARSSARLQGVAA